jgi:hypothetical protein
MPSIPFDIEDAVELAELLEFLGDWLESDRAVLAASLAQFVGVPGYGSDSLREDFARFRFLLGFTDGEGLFSSAEARRRGQSNADGSDGAQ